MRNMDVYLPEVITVSRILREINTWILTTANSSFHINTYTK